MAPADAAARAARREEGETLAYLVAKNPAAAGLYPQLAYLLDISNIARNALALPLPGEVPAPPPPPAAPAPVGAAAAAPRAPAPVPAGG